MEFIQGLELWFVSLGSTSPDDNPNVRAPPLDDRASRRASQSGQQWYYKVIVFGKNPTANS